MEFLQLKARLSEIMLKHHLEKLCCQLLPRREEDSIQSQDHLLSMHGRESNTGLPITNDKI
eukprot:scaffold5111_cov84-Skeletonema_dohrnii-CCMP3373.AAC.5